MSARQFYYKADISAVRQGPVSADWLWDQVSSGALGPETRVCEVGTTYWCTFADLPDAVFSVRVLHAAAAVPMAPPKRRTLNSWLVGILLFIGLAYTPLADYAPILSGARHLTDDLLSVIGIHTSPAYSRGHIAGTSAGGRWGHIPSKFPSATLLQGMAANAFGHPTTHGDWGAYSKGFSDGFTSAYHEAYAHSTGTEMDLESDARREVGR